MAPAQSTTTARCVPCPTLLAVRERPNNILLGMVPGQLVSQSLGIKLSTHDGCVPVPQEWDDWLQDTLAGEGRTPEQRKGLMVKWEKAPSARVAQPEESHLLPLHVALGSAHCGQAKVIFKGPLFGAAISSYQWD